jgi:signal transduction histidine kinase
MTTAASVTDRATDKPLAAGEALVGSPPLSRYFIALVAVAILPLALVASLLIWRQAADERRATENTLQSTAHALSVAVDRQLLSYRRVLEALAASESIDRRDFAAMYAYAKRVADLKGAVFISLFDSDGRQLFNTARPFGAPLPDPYREAQPAAHDTLPFGDASSLKRVFATGQPSNSDLFVALATRRVLFTVDVPVIRDGRVLYVINAAFPPELVTRLLTQDEELKQVRSVVVDGRGFYVGRWQEAEKYAGQRARPETLALIRQSDTGSAFDLAADGEYEFRSFVRSHQTGWTTMVGVSAAKVRQDEKNTWLLWGSGALAVLLLSAGFAIRLAGRLDRSIRRLAEAAASDAMVPVDYGMPSRELDRLRDALVDSKESRAGALRALETALTSEARRVEAEAANREKDRFMAAVVHELRNPLAALTNVSALLKAGIADERVSGIVERQVGQLTRLVDDLLETSRVNFGKFQLEIARIDLRDVVRQAVESTAMRHKHRRHAVEVQSPDAPLMVDGDRARLVQVLANILDNAMKFTPVGGRIRVEIAEHVGHAVIAVVDSGDGIDPQFLPHVFDRFTQAATTPGATEGLGLGLAVARDLVLAHRGRLEAANEPGGGARFTVTLPLVALGE